MEARYAVGVDVGGTHIAAALMDRTGRIATPLTTDTPQAKAAEVIDAIVDVIARVAAGTNDAEIAGIGIGLPAQIDYTRQSVEWCTNLPLAGVDVSALVAERTGHAVVIENDGNCAGVGEARFGAAKGVHDVVMITLGTGVGGAILLGGEPCRGARGMAGEIGHMVVRQGGAPCPCGDAGHLEAYLGSRAIAASGQDAARASGGEDLLGRAGGIAEAVTTRNVIEAAAAGDAVACRILLEAGELLGEALVGIVNLLNPTLIVVGGGIGESADLLVERAARVVADRALEGRRDVTVVRAELSNSAGILGAAALAFDAGGGPRDARRTEIATRGEPGIS